MMHIGPLHRVDLACPLHKHFNPASGRGAPQHACRVCNALIEAHSAYLKAEKAIGRARYLAALQRDHQTGRTVQPADVGGSQ